jgi:GLPGLI family protein
MNSIFLKFSLTGIILLISLNISAQDFQGKAFYFSKSTMELGSWGATMSEAQKKQVYERLKNRLEKTYILTFNVQESIFKEEEKLDAISGATDSWGKNFTPGEQYKNLKSNTLLQEQEFYGKQFLVKDKLLALDWNMTADSKQIGGYMCMKAVALIPSEELAWYNFSWDSLRNNENKEEVEGTVSDSTEVKQIKMTQIEAWYTPQIPVSNGPMEYGGLPGLILEVSADGTTMLCSKIIMNPAEKIKIEAPKKGTEVTKMEYQAIITEKMAEMRNMYSGRRGR